MTTAITSTSITSGNLATTTLEKTPEAVQQLMQNLALSQQQVITSSQTKDQAFADRAKNLTEILQALEKEQAILQAQLIGEESEMTTSAQIHAAAKASLEAKSKLLTEKQLEHTQLIVTVNQEIRALEETYKLKLKDLEAKESQLNATITSYNKQYLELSGYHSVLVQSCNSHGFR